MSALAAEFAYLQWCYYQSNGDAAMSAYWWSEYVRLSGEGV